MASARGLFEGYEHSRRDCADADALGLRRRRAAGLQRGEHGICAGVREWAVQGGEVMGKKVPEAGEYRVPIEQRFDPDFIAQMAVIMGVGAKKYGPDMWKSGLTGANGGVNHALKHIVEYQNGTLNDYGHRSLHLAQAAVNLMFEAYFCRKEAGGG